MEKLKEFLAAPDKMQDEFWESDVLIWIDWREYDEDIIQYFNEKLPDEDEISFKCVDIDKERGVDIILKKNGVETPIPYVDDRMDRDTTLKSIQEYLAPKYQIRCYLDSLGCDTLAFCIYPTLKWYQLEQEFGSDKVAYYFVPIRPDINLFEMDMNEVFRLLKVREKN